MSKGRRYVGILCAFFLLLLAVFFWSHLRSASSSGSLSVTFVGLTNNPVRTWTPTRMEVCPGATGLCGLFMVRNVTSNRWFWFKTVGIEQKTEQGWQTFEPGGSWSGVEGGAWTPGYGCLYAVSWPPGLSTNATWRLRVGYGRDPSALGRLLNQKFGTIFRSGEREGVVLSAEVSQ